MAGGDDRRNGRRPSAGSLGVPDLGEAWSACADRMRREHGVDPRKLKPVELCRLLNSTPLGPVIDAGRLGRHRNLAGMRIAAKGDAQRVDLLRYTAWLFGRRRAKVSPQAAGLEGYDAVRERARERGRLLSLSGRNIGELPAVVNPRRRKRCERDFRLFCETYFRPTFRLKWSADHLRVIARIEECVLSGGLFAMAMPRGSGKSSLCEIACLWSIVYGHRGFVVVIGPDENHAVDQLDSIKTELEHNDLLLEDFPEVCYPIRALEGIYQRANGQLYRGKPTLMTWSNKELVLPRIEGSQASGAIIRVAGLTGQIRGMKYKLSDGRTVRPDLALVDDPQTDESARSPSQCATRERLLSGAVLGLAGPGQKIAGLMTLTVVVPEDLADTMLDRKKHPEWRGERTSMVYSFPADEGSWREYAEILRRDLAEGRDARRATAYYRRHRKRMDAGAKVAWPERKEPGELSAIQHAMNIRIIRGDAAFHAEYQNTPLPEGMGESPLTPAAIAGKLNRLERGLVPGWAQHLTAMIDVQGELLFYVVSAWADDFTGAVVDYGAEPEQAEEYFTLRDARKTLSAKHKGPKGGKSPGLEALLYAGLEDLAERVLGREWKRDDGARLRIDRCLVDANWGDSTDTVYLWCRQSKFAAQLYPSHGRGVAASHLPFSEYRKQRGDRVGFNWRIPSVRGKRTVRHVVYDTNAWKSFVAQRWAVGMGDPGCLALFGQDPRAHRLFADHVTAEYPVRTTGRGRELDEWKLKQPGLDNHWLDCLVGSAVAASVQGAKLFGEEPVGRARRRIKLSELQQRRR